MGATSTGWLLLVRIVVGQLGVGAVLAGVFAWRGLGDTTTRIQSTPLMLDA